MSNKLFTPKEAELLTKIAKYPGYKLCYEDVNEHVDDGSEHGKDISLYKNLENLGLIECVGSYKWRPTSRLTIAVLVDGNTILIGEKREGIQ